MAKADRRGPIQRIAHCLAYCERLARKISFIILELHSKPPNFKCFAIDFSKLIHQLKSSSSRKKWWKLASLITAAIKLIKLWLVN